MNMLIVQGFRLSRPVGQLFKKNELFKKKYIIHILMQLAVGHKLGLVHRDPRSINPIIESHRIRQPGKWRPSTVSNTH
jgi:hypothetical protein